MIMSEPASDWGRRHDGPRTGEAPLRSARDAQGRGFGGGGREQPYRRLQLRRLHDLLHLNLTSHARTCTLASRPTGRGGAGRGRRLLLTPDFRYVEVDAVGLQIWDAIAGGASVGRSR